MEKKVILVIVFGVLLLSIVFGGVLLFSPDTSPNSNTVLDYKAEVCIHKNGKLLECSHNVLYNSGKNMTRDLFSGSGAAVLNITLCNATTTGSGCGIPVATATENYNEYTVCGLKGATGTKNTIGSSPGNWTVSNTFTSATCSGSLLVNATRLGNNSDYFAGNNFTLVTLDPTQGDTLTVNWSIEII